MSSSSSSIRTLQDIDQPNTNVDLHFAVTALSLLKTAFNASATDGTCSRWFREKQHAEISALVDVRTPIKAENCSIKRHWLQNHPWVKNKGSTIPKKNSEQYNYFSSLSSNFTRTITSVKRPTAVATGIVQDATVSDESAPSFWRLGNLMLTHFKYVKHKTFIMYEYGRFAMTKPGPSHAKQIFTL